MRCDREAYAVALTTSMTSPVRGRGASGGADRGGVALGVAQVLVDRGDAEAVLAEMWGLEVAGYW